VLSLLVTNAVLGEGDLIYTKTLCRIGYEDYANKTVLILGGGDGGILHELRKENVGFVTMAEIGILLVGDFLMCVLLTASHLLQSVVRVE